MSSNQSRGIARGRGQAQQRGASAAGGGDSRGAYRGRGQARGGAYQRDDRGGGDGRPRRPPFELQVSRNVRQLAERVAIKRVSRRGHGVEGQPIELISNHYPLPYEDITCFHYNIQIRIHRNDGNGFINIVGPQERKLRNDMKMDNIRVVRKMADEWPQVFANKFYVFDGQKNLYCGQRLSEKDSKATVREVSIQLDGFQEQRFQVKIQFAKEVPMSSLNDFFANVLRNPTSDEFRELIQAIEIALRYMPSQTRIGVGRNLYSKDGRIRISGGNAEIGFGHYQSVQLTECGLTLNVDRTATLFRRAGTLKEFIEREIESRDLDAEPFNANHMERMVYKINPKIKGLKIFTTHIVNQKRRYFIESMTCLKPDECKFNIKSTDGTTELISIKDYFLREYNLSLKFRNIPCIQLKGGLYKRYLPVEVCHVYEDQPVPRRLITPVMTKQIVEVSNRQKPIERFGLNQESAEAIANESQGLHNSFGIRLALKPIQLTGRVLPAPKLIGDDRVVKDGKRLQRWLFYSLSHDVNQNFKHYFNQFFNDERRDERGNRILGLIDTARGKGIHITPINVPANPFIRIPDIEETIKRAKSESFQMIFFCIPKVDEMYYAIKYYADIVYGIPTQCLNDERFMNTPPGYHKNILLKINAKLDGQNQVLSSPQRPDMFTGAKNQTMIVGVDVTHPGTNPLANERVISSIAASVASFDSEFSKFVANISVQPMNTEIIGNYDDMFGQNLKHFREKNKTLPQSVIVFRDGVSEGQFSQVIDNEIPLIEKAFRKYNTIPKITVFVVQKRHHTRFMPLHRTNDFRGREIHNIPAGTVVDHTLVNPLYNEFHLCSHNGMLGTSRHAKYVCLRDDHNWSEDQKQMLSFYLCHTYCRCTKSISIPTPVMYAHLAAFRAKQHIAAQNIEFENKTSGETDEQKRKREERSIRCLNGKIQVNPNLVSLPYYS